MDEGMKTSLKELEISEEDTNESIGQQISDNLKEPNTDLIIKILNILGRDKGIDFYYKTKHTEENGGIMTVNGSRRRTPGGVFFYLITQDPEISRKTMKEIFSETWTREKQKKNQVIKERRKKKNNELKLRLIKEGLLTTINTSEEESSSVSDMDISRTSL